MLQKLKFLLENWQIGSVKFSLRLRIEIVAIFLSLVFLPLVLFYVEYKKNAIKPLQYSVDSILSRSYLLERELARFSAQLHTEYGHSLGYPTAPTQVLKQRYEILVSRFLSVKNLSNLDVLSNLPEFQRVNASMEEFIKKIDPIMDMVGNVNANFNDLRVILNEVEKNHQLLIDLTNIVQSVVYDANDKQAALVETQGRWIFGLIAVEGFLLIGALLALLLYIGKQRQQNLALVKVTEEAKAASLLAEQANHAKGMFLANMSHELRTPFQGMMGMLHLLSETPLTATQHDYATTAQTSARHLLGILNDILDSSAIDSGAMALNIAPLNLHDLIHEVETLMQSTASQKNIDLRVLGIKNLPIWIEGDAKRLSQVLFNLLNNAIKFTEVGEVILELNVLQAASGGQLPVLSFEVKDTGIGMTAETVKTLFARFHQADNTIHRRYGGSGLGLEISLNLAKLMGGGITVDSTEGVGTTFTFEFPFQTAKAPLLPQATVISPVKNLRILIAEDHPINVKYLEILLNNMGHTTVTCENGARVLECLKVHQVDVILMDLHMPVLDGVSTTRAIRSLGGALADVKIIMVSADILPEARRLAFDAGVTEFLSKPVQSTKLLKALNRCFEVSLNEFEATRSDANMFDENLESEVFNVRFFYEFRDLMPIELVKKQLKTFFGEDREAVRIISGAIDSEIRKDVSEEAHALKGICQLLGFMAMAQTLAKIEISASDSTLDSLNSLLAQFQDDIDRTRQILISASLLH